jgi:adhesin transport system outer membrane protein
VAIAVESNPEIGAAIENREAVQFELRQAYGLFLPSVDLEGSIGARRLDNPTRRALGTDDKTLHPGEIGATVTQRIFDGYETRSEIRRQASRVDGASFRVLERSEYIALQVSREYFEYLLQQRIVEIARRNLSVHQSILGDIREGADRGPLTEADNLQAQERLYGAQARLKEATEELDAAKIRFNRLVAIPIGSASMPPSMASRLPRSLDGAIGMARENNPEIKIAGADVDAADALIDKARSDYYPKFSIEANARTGDDIDGTEGRTDDLRARVVMRWNVFRGGITSADEQEQIRRATEQRFRLHDVHREIEEAVRISWDRRIKQGELQRIYNQQFGAENRVVSAYRDQFRVGRRSLLDVLDAQNNLFNVAVLRETAAYASRFAEYRLLAATGRLLTELSIQPPAQSEAIAREVNHVPPTPPARTDRRTVPPIGNPLNLGDFRKETKETK